MTGAGRVMEIEGTLTGTALVLTAAGRRFEGVVGDAAIEGAGGAWRAGRAG